MKIELNKDIFSGNKEAILVTGSPPKLTNTAAPSGFGWSAHHSGSYPAKYSKAAKVLDYILASASVKCLESDEQIYAEFGDGANVYKVVSDGKTDSYEGSAPNENSSLRFIPSVLHAMRSKTAFAELRTVFDRIVLSGIPANIEDVVRFCDSFYYQRAKVDPVVEIAEHDLEMATVRAAIRSGELRPFASLESFIPSVYAEEMGADPSATAPSKAAQPKSDIFEEIKAGKKLIPFEWASEQSRKIPNLSRLDDFVPREEFYGILNKTTYRLNKVLERLDAGIEGVEAIGNDYVNLMMVGKPGTGKTTIAYALGAATGMPVYSVALNKNSEADTFEGKTKVVDGNLQFVSTEFLDAYTNGGIIVLEEVNLANPNITMGSIGQAIEYPFVLMKDGYEPITRHPMCIIIGTMNVATYGSLALNEAFSSRFKTTYILDDPEAEDFLRILEKTGAKPKTCKWVYGAYVKVINYLMEPKINNEDMCMRLTMRGCIGALEAIEEGEAPKQALRRTLVGKIAEVDLELANLVWKDVIQTLPECR